MQLRSLGWRTDASFARFDGQMIDRYERLWDDPAADVRTADSSEA